MICPRNKLLILLNDLLMIKLWVVNWCILTYKSTKLHVIISLMRKTCLISITNSVIYLWSSTKYKQQLTRRPQTPHKSEFASCGLCYRYIWIFTVILFLFEMSKNNSFKHLIHVLQAIGLIRIWNWFESKQSWAIIRLRNANYVRKTSFEICPFYNE